MIETEMIDCPYCGASWPGRRIADTYTSRPMTEEEQADYLLRTAEGGNA